MLKLLAFLKPFRGPVALVLALALAQSLAGLYLPRLMADIVDHGIVPGDTRQILIYRRPDAADGAGQHRCRRRRQLLFRQDRDRLRPRSSATGSSTASRTSRSTSSITFSTASLITRTTNDTTQVQQVLIMMLTMVITAPMMAIGGIILSLSQDAQLARVLIAVIPILGADLLPDHAQGRAAVPADAGQDRPAQPGARRRADRRARDPRVRSQRAPEPALRRRQSRSDRQRRSPSTGWCRC